MADVLRHWARMALLLVCASWSLFQLYAVATAEQVPGGFEAERVARALAGGHGFSLPNNLRWITEPGPGYGPTAWVDPVFPAVFAGLFVLAGERAPKLMMVVNVAASIGTLVVLFALVRRAAPSVAGIVACLALAVQHWFGVVTLGLNNAAFGMLLVALTALLLLRALEETRLAAALGLGACLGISALTASSTLLLVFAVPVLILLLARDPMRARLHAAATVLAVAASLIAPWTIRNAMTFGEMVPVRTGAGQLTHAGTVMLGGTVAPERSRLAVLPEWRARTAREAVRRAASTNGRNELESAQRRSFDASPPAGYASMNEAQRDEAYLAAAIGYVVQEPALNAQLALHKLELFARRLGTAGNWTILIAALSALLLLRDRQVLAVAVLIALQAAPFAIFITYFHRYRALIEPLIVATACIGVARLASGLARYARHLWSRVETAEYPGR